MRPLLWMAALGLVGCGKGGDFVGQDPGGEGSTGGAPGATGD